MKTYLEKKFDEALNSTESFYDENDGKLTISGVPYYASEILNRDEIAYKDAFIVWKDQRVLKNKDKAHEILAKYSNKKRFSALKKIYSNSKVIPFVGAGMSISSGFPSWTGFLRELLEECTYPESSFNELIDRGEYEELAEQLEQSLGESLFFEHIENTFVQHNDIEGAVYKIPEIFKDTVITTNFDNVLERVYEECSLKFNEIELGAQLDYLPKLLSSTNSVLLKLHGRADRLEKRILTKTEYEKYYSEDNHIDKIIGYFCNYSLLFLGCSLTVDRTITCLREIVAEKGAKNLPRHYAFLCIKNKEDKIKREKELAEANIFPIWYEDDHDESIEALLEYLMMDGN